MRTARQGKTYEIEDCCEDCYDQPDKKCCRVGEYLAKLSAQRERKGNASSSSFSMFSLSIPVLLSNLPSPVCTGVVTTASSLSVCSVTYSAATPVVLSTPFAPPLNVTPVEPSCKRHCQFLLEDHLE